jgi:DNA-binding MarR family transcriptional regulator
VSSHKRELLEELVEEVRRSQNATDRFDQAVADALGINRTDMRCTDVLEREGAVTAGHLAEVTGLTTGAITTVIDRLERRGFARRVRDPADRRRVLVELTDEAREQGRAFWVEHSRYGQRLYRRYNEKELELILEFVRGGRELNERRAAEVERQNAGGGAAG